MKLKNSLRKIRLLESCDQVPFRIRRYICLVSLNRYIHPHDLPEVVTRIKAELYPQLEIRLRNSLNAGEEISFGPIGLNKNGVICRTNHYTWDQISQIFIDKGILKVEMSGGNVFHQSLRYIPNLEILILLVREFEKS